MRRFRIVAFTLPALLLAGAVMAQQKKVAEKPKTEGAKDKVEVVLAAGAEKTKAVATVWATNINPTMTFSIPLKFMAQDSAWVDSVSFADTRAGYFEPKGWKFHPEQNALMILMMAPAKDKKFKHLEPGTGKIARIYLSCKTQFPMESFRMGPVTLPPSNTLMFVTDANAKAEPVFEFRLEGAPPPKK